MKNFPKAPCFAARAWSLDCPRVSTSLLTDACVLPGHIEGGCGAKTSRINKISGRLEAIDIKQLHTSEWLSGMCRCRPSGPIAPTSFQNRRRIRDFGRFEARPPLCELHFRAETSLLLKTAKSNGEFAGKKGEKAYGNPQFHCWAWRLILVLGTAHELLDIR